MILLFLELLDLLVVLVYLASQGKVWLSIAFSLSCAIVVVNPTNCKKIVNCMVAIFVLKRCGKALHKVFRETHFLGEKRHMYVVH